MAERRLIACQYGVRDDRHWGLLALGFAAIFAAAVLIDPFGSPKDSVCSLTVCFSARIMMLLLTLVLGFWKLLSKPKSHGGYIDIDDDSVLAPLGESPGELRRLMTWEIERIRFVWAVPTDRTPRDRLIIEGGIPVL